jgi:hypothetical protein
MMRCDEWVSDFQKQERMTQQLVYIKQQFSSTIIIKDFFTWSFGQSSRFLRRYYITRPKVMT